MGSSLSLRNFARLGSAFSLFGALRGGPASIGGSLSVMENGNMGSALSLRSFVRMGSSLSMCSFVSFGSSLALRTYSRLGSSVSVNGRARFGSAVSVVECTNMASALSVRSFARIGATMSIYDFVAVGSSLSVRRFSRLGSSFSVFGRCQLGSTISVFDSVCVGSAISLRSFMRCGASLSLLAFPNFGSSLSLRSCQRLGASLSMQGISRLGSSMSVNDEGHFGSSLSVRSYARLGSSLSLGGALHFSNSKTYVRYDAAQHLTVRVGGNRGMSITPTGGSLHGIWFSESAVTVSDRRLKRSIMPLAKSLAEEAKITQRSGEGAGAVTTTDLAEGKDRSVSVNWVLRELRPVSFKFKHGPESKYLRYGFVAQEVQQVLPSIVRGNEPGEKHLSVVYQDLIALLTLATQEQQTEQEKLRDQLKEQNKKMDILLQHIKDLEYKIDQRMHWTAPAQPAQQVQGPGAQSDRWAQPDIQPSAQHRGQRGGLPGLPGEQPLQV